MNEQSETDPKLTSSQGGGHASYVRDPAAIYAKSFAIVRAEARLERFDPHSAEMVLRLIHACGMVDIAETLAISNNCVPRGQAALQSGAPIICDCEMVASGIIRRGLPAANEIICTLNDARTAPLAKKLNTTRSAAATEMWLDRLEGAIVVIGNAPTALFHLLDGLDQGWPNPAAILGFPVGFVGAAESKSELAMNPRDVPFATLPGRRGGSAMAAAALNALTLGLNGDGR